MFNIGLITIVLVIVFFSQGKTINFGIINKKLKRAILVSIIFSILGFVRTYLLVNKIQLNELILYSVVDLMLIISVFGLYKKNRIFTALIMLILACSIYVDQLITLLQVKPIITFIIYLRTIVYFDIIWNGVLSVIVYHRNLRQNQIYRGD